MGGAVNALYLSLSPACSPLEVVQNDFGGLLPCTTYRAELAMKRQEVIARSYIQDGLTRVLKPGNELAWAMTKLDSWNGKYPFVKSQQLNFFKRPKFLFRLHSLAIPVGITEVCKPAFLESC